MASCILWINSICHKAATLTSTTPTFTSPTRDLTPPQKTTVAPLHHSLSTLRLSRPQAKLTVSQPGDSYEQEADRVAEQVMSMLDSATQQSIQREAMPEEEELQMKPLTDSITPLVQREALPEDEEEDEEELQMKPSLQRSPDGGFQATSNLENQLSSSQGGGSPLPNGVRSVMEPRFGFNFQDVWVHTDSEAVQMNRDLSAQAFTHGSDIYFGAGKFPAISNLTAHELTHVLQQMGGVQLQSEEVEKPADKATRMNQDFDAAMQKGEWGEAALILNGFAMFDVLPRAAKLDTGQLDKLSQAAAGTMKDWPPRVQFAAEVVKNSKLPAEELQNQINPDQVEDAKKFLDNLHRRVGSDITSVFEGGEAGSLQTKDEGIISYGKHQATLASGSLYSVLKTYTELSKTTTATETAKYLDRVKKKDDSLRDDKTFIQVLKDAAGEPEMDRA